MNTHEFQAKQILQRYGIAMPPFYVISSIQEIDHFLQVHQWPSVVLKVQVHAGGRGKAGGVKIAHNLQAIKQTASELLGKKIVNQQTGPEGMRANQLLISPTVDIVKEFYLGAIISREQAQGVVIASPVGGVDIEQVAQDTPEKVLILPISSEGTLHAYQILRLIKFMGWKNDLAQQGIKLVKGLVQAFCETDASLLEINPLAETQQGELIALDAKLVVDENALFRQPEIKSFFDPTQVSPNEARAQQQELAYIALDGEIGCMVNGAGLAMATMDIIQYFGGRPANFLDVGGGASKEKIAEGFKIILSDPKVKAIFVNIFGGIMNCETLASGIIEAAKEQHIHVPLIVRMEGTNVEQGKKMLQDANLNIIISHSLTEAAQKAVKVAN